MKKLVLFLAAVLMTAIGANVFAQTDTGTTPFVGSQHTYSVTLNTGNDYAWDVTSDEGGATSVIGSVVTLSSSGGEDVNSIDITWVNPSIGTTYYVHVTETDDELCSNRKALAVTPQNAFELQIVSVDEGDGSDLALGTAGSWCAPPVTVVEYEGADNSLAETRKFQYDYGVKTVYYHVTASGINVSNTDWTADFNITFPYTAARVTATYGTLSGTTFTSQGDINSGSAITSGATYQVTRSGNDNFYIQLTVDLSLSSEDTYDNDGFEGLTAQDLVTTLEMTSTDENTNAVTEINGTVVTDDDSSTQNIKARPSTSEIGTTEP